jgi:hypothetical protein
MKVSRLIAPALALLVAAPAVAQYQSPQTVRFVSATGPSAFGVRVGPYRLQLQGEPGQPTIDAFCVDFEHNVRSSWTANIVGLNGDLSSTRQYQIYGNTAVTQARYRAAAYLAQTMLTQPQSTWWRYHGAIWYIMSGPTLTSSDAFYSPFNALSSTNENVVRNLALYALNTGYSTVDHNGWAVITPTNYGYSTSSQEFITRNVVPEPETVILLGSGLLLLGLVALRRSNGSV